MASGILRRLFAKEVIYGPRDYVRGVARYLLFAAGAHVRLVRKAWRGDVEVLASGARLDARAAAGDAIGVELLVRLAVGALVGTATGRHEVKSRPTVRRRIRWVYTHLARQNPRDRGTRRVMQPHIRQYERGGVCTSDSIASTGASARLRMVSAYQYAESFHVRTWVS